MRAEQLCPATRPLTHKNNTNMWNLIGCGRFDQRLIALMFVGRLRRVTDASDSDRAATSWLAPSIDDTLPYVVFKMVFILLLASPLSFSCWETQKASLSAIVVDVVGAGNEHAAVRDSHRDWRMCLFTERGRVWKKMSVAVSVAFLEHHILILCKNANQQFKESFACKDLDRKMVC